VTQPHDEDWQAIVENFGETPDADQIAAEVTPPAVSSAHPAGQEDDPGWFEESRAGDSWPDEERYIPPPPPPLPALPRRQRAAWMCLIGGPGLLLMFLFSGFKPPAWLMLTILTAIVTSFVYLIFWSPRTPREPWEDGAQI
jgi:hypothetical protein